MDGEPDKAKLTIYLEYTNEKKYVTIIDKEELSLRKFLVDCFRYHSCPIHIRMNAVIAISCIREEIHQIHARKPTRSSHLADDGPDAFLQRLGS